MRALLLGGVFLFFVFSNAWSADIKGADHPEFKAAKEAWLNDDDQSSLPVLASLANEGNVAARLTLAGIEVVHKRGVSDYFKSLSRKEKISLMRQAKGLSGTSWLRVEEENTPLAKTIIESWKPDVSVTLAKELNEQGEPHMAMEVVERLMRAGKYSDVLSLANEGILLPERQHLVWLAAGFVDDKALIEEGALEAEQNNPVALLGSFSSEGDAELKRKAVFFGDFDAPIVTDELAGKLENWLLTDNSMAPLADMCRMECPQQVGACARITYQLLPDYDMVAAHDSPLESTISHQEFIQSKRSRNILLRYAAARVSDEEVSTAQSLAGRGTVNFKKVEKVSSCLAVKISQYR